MIFTPRGPWQQGQPRAHGPKPISRGYTLDFSGNFTIGDQFNAAVDPGIAADRWAGRDFDNGQFFVLVFYQNRSHGHRHTRANLVAALRRRFNAGMNPYLTR